MPVSCLWTLHRSGAVYHTTWIPKKHSIPTPMLIVINKLAMVLICLDKAKLILQRMTWG